jgi:hypothetical protein
MEINMWLINLLTIHQVANNLLENQERSAARGTTNNIEALGEAFGT